MLGLGVFQHWMVPSTPPLKHCSPVLLITTLSTAPLWFREGLTSQLCHWDFVISFKLGGAFYLLPVGSECVDGFHV